MNFKLYSSIAKMVKLKVKKFWGIILMSAEVTDEKLVGSPTPEEG